GAREAGVQRHDGLRRRSGRRRARAPRHRLPDRSRPRARPGQRHLPRLRPHVRLCTHQRGVPDVTPVVVKIGGAVAGTLPPLPDGAVVVHGAGPQISAEMELRGIPVRFVRGRRVTDAATLEVVAESLRAVNEELCASIPDSIGLVGVLEATPIPGLGLVGEPLPVAPSEVVAALAAGLVPVVAPLAPGLNVNADDAAAALAVALGAERLQFVTDVPGLLVADEVVSEIDADAAEEFLPDLDGGIVPKLLAAVVAVRGGVPAHIGATAVLP